MIKEFALTYRRALKTVVHIKGNGEHIAAASNEERNLLGRRIKQDQLSFPYWYPRGPLLLGKPFSRVPFFDALTLEH